MNKEIKALVKAAEAQGFTVTRTRNGHLRWSRGGEFVTISPSTPSDRRGMLNLRAALKRAGFKPAK
ncbi:type II toxin-antitoxin system HicA family toxin [Cellulosimicrobium sp. TH-20]|uniref:type II toxin-antitoxin system HicA family toxin n=1 Tax=Cellulosimicrobium sp. TH-20 TaxID=1980001 RepID=UPI0011AA69E9|nr:type II toxin-antitoxin system HicA family toxin [Cellulosimicrobium sp. TH-20]